MTPPLPAPFSTADGAKLPTFQAPEAPAPPPPEHVAIDIPAAAFARLVVAKEGGAPTPPAPPQPERGAKKNHPAAARPDPFVRTLAKAMWVAYLLTLAPSALVGSALLYGGEATFLVLGVFSLGVITGALFHVREDEDKETQAQAKG